MDNSRQRAFQTLRPPCVELSSVALKFRANQAAIKTVLLALEEYCKVVSSLGHDHALDEKLAEYAFFPLSHIFNESRRLSPRVLELAINALQCLVSQGWGKKLSPDMGKQLLILLTLLVGGSPGRAEREPPTDELKLAVFQCLATIAKCMGQSIRGRAVFHEVGARTIVDQCVYMLLETITDQTPPQVQIAASNALLELQDQISSRVLLASLLPRTVSALTKSLRPTTKAKRTYKVLQTNLNLLTKTLQPVLNDVVALPHGKSRPDFQATTQQGIEHGESDTLDAAWLRATSSQVKLALSSVIKLRDHERAEVREMLAELCLMVVEECPKSLSESVPLMLETLVVLADDTDSKKGLSTLKYLLTSNPALIDSLKSTLHTWTGVLPRLMQRSDDRPKQVILKQISTTFQVLSEMGETSDVLDDLLAASLMESVSAALSLSATKSPPAVSESALSLTQLCSLQKLDNLAPFNPVLIRHGSQKESLTELQALIVKFQGSETFSPMTRSILSRIPFSTSNSQLAAIWLSLQLLTHTGQSQILMEDFLDVSANSSLTDTRAYLISDLYSLTLPFLLDNMAMIGNSSPDWRLSALALESLILQAVQLGPSYRPELVDTLYPVLSLLGSSHPQLQTHAITTLNLLAKACDYPSTVTMLVDSVDYLVNSIALKLNTFDIDPQAPQVLLILVKLCGVRLIPYLDDLIGSIFAALDNFHGYSKLVELLFAVLTAVVDEGAKRPEMGITDGREAPEHKNDVLNPSTVSKVLADIRARKSREQKSQSDMPDTPQKTPHRPWSSALDGPVPVPPSEAEDGNTRLEEDGESSTLQPPGEKVKPLSKPHQLLLSIALSTTPHLSSPSLRVRLTLLQLLTRVSPLLARDENSFLPLINSVWPAIVPRLFGELGADGEREPGFVACAAADTVSAMCTGAGDFIAGRIEDIVSNLGKLYDRVWGRLATDRARRRQRQRDSGRRISSMTGMVDLRLLRPESRNVDESEEGIVPSPVSSSTHTTDVQLHNALVGLLVTILSYVHVTDDTGDLILAMLTPIMDEPGREQVREALESWNADAVWIYRERARIEKDMARGQRMVGDWRWSEEEKPVIPRMDGGRWVLVSTVF